MRRCDRCGNEYDRTFDLTIGGDTHTFDSFECAIASVAPRCETCGTPIIGHGVQAGETIYCCANCAERDGETELQDRV